MLLPLISVFWPGPTLAQEATVDPPPIVASISWEADFSRAVESYLQGNLSLAKADFLRLAADAPGIPIDRLLEARVYLAEVEYYLGERDASWRSCLAVLTVDPEYRIDPFVHPPELVAYFDSVRAAQARVLPEEPDPDPPFARVGVALIPGAIQFRNGQPALGVFTGAAVGGLGITTATLYFNLRSYDQQRDTPGIQVTETNEQRAQDLKTWTNITRWSAVGLWALGVSQGLVRASRHQAGVARVAPLLHPDGLGVTVLW